MCQLGDRLIVLADISLSFPAWSMPRIFNSGPLFAPRMQKAAASIYWTLQDYLTYQSYTALINLNCQESIVYLLQSPASFLSASLGLGIQLAYTIWEILDSTCWGGRMQYLIDWEWYIPEARCWFPAQDTLGPVLNREFHAHHHHIHEILNQSLKKHTNHVTWLISGLWIVIPVHYQTQSFKQFFETLTQTFNSNTIELLFHDKFISGFYRVLLSCLFFFAFAYSAYRPFSHLIFLIIIFTLIFSINLAFASKPACENICVKKKVVSSLY